MAHRTLLLALTAAALLVGASEASRQRAGVVALDDVAGLANAQDAGCKTHARSLLHGGIVHEAGEEQTDAGVAPDSSTRSYQWLKWVAGAVLLVEGLLGVLMPVLLKATIHATWLLSLINCFAAAVFFSFGVLHLGPDAMEAQSKVGLDRFPLAPFLVALSFFVVFFLHRVLAPALRLKSHRHGHAVVAPGASRAGCGACGNDCGCAGGVGAGNCGQACSAGACQCATRKDSCGSLNTDTEQGAAGFGLAASSMAAAVTPAGRQTSGESRRRQAIALVAPVIIMGGVLCHTVLEGLVIGLQQSYANVVTAFVAMASHKWVESIAVATVFMAAGSGLLAIVGFLVPFSLGPIVGIAIGVSVDSSNNWAVLVLFALVAGLFIYVGTMGIIAEEFSRFDDSAYAATTPRGACFYMFAAMFAGFTVVSLLQLVPEAD